MTTTATHVNPINIGMDDEQRQGVVNILTRVLADEHVLYLKLRKYHWNVVGPQFHSLHEIFEEQYTKLANDIDDIAERIRFIGGRAIGTLEEFSRYTTLSEDPGQYPEAMTMIANLVADHEAIIRNLRSDQEAAEDEYNDAGTNDFLIALMQSHEEMAWMLRSFLQERP